MPYKDPEKARAAAREAMRRKRASPAAKAEERRQKAITRGGDNRFSTRYLGSPEQGKAKHGFVDRIAYNYGHAEGGKPQQRDLTSIKVHRRRWDGDFEPDEPTSNYQRVVRLARAQTGPLPDGGDLYNGDPDARAWYVYFRAKGARVLERACVDLAAKIRRLGADAGRVAVVLRQHSDLSPCPRATLQKISQLSDGQLSTALLILRQQGLLREHRNTWPPEYSVNPPSARG